MSAPERSLEEIILEQLEGEMASVFDCMRDWEAWQAGTMRESDFVPIQDRLVPIVHSLASAVRAALSPKQGAMPKLGDQLPDLEFANGEYVSVYEALGAELDAKDAEIARLISRTLEAEAKLNLERFSRCECWWNPETGYLEACAEHLDKLGTKPDVCANCGKVYADHLLHDGNKCTPGSINGWFPKKVADAFKASMQKTGGGHGTR